MGAADARDQAEATQALELRARAALLAPSELGQFADAQAGVVGHCIQHLGLRAAAEVHEGCALLVRDASWGVEGHVAPDLDDVEEAAALEYAGVVLCGLEGGAEACCGFAHEDSGLGAREVEEGGAVRVGRGLGGGDALVEGEDGKGEGCCGGLREREARHHEQGREEKSGPGARVEG